jgi:hypothetical protein
MEDAASKGQTYDDARPVQDGRRYACVGLAV